MRITSIYFGDDDADIEHFVIEYARLNRASINWVIKKALLLLMQKTRDEGDCPAAFMHGIHE